MGWGSKQTTTSSNTQTGSSTSTPNINPLAQNLYSSTLFPQAQQLIQDANKPVYGDAAKAGVLNNLNELADSASKHLNSTLASRGALGSGDFDRGQQGIEQQRFGGLADFYSQLPAMEAQAHQQRLSSALGLGAGLAGQLPVGQTSENGQTGSTTQVQSSSPGWSSLVGALAGGASSMLTGGLMGGLGSMMGGPSSPGGGSFGGGFSQAMNSYFPQMPQQWGSPPTQPNAYSIH